MEVVMKVMSVCAVAIVSTIAVGVAQERGPQPLPQPQPRATQATAGMPTGSGDFAVKVAESGAVEVALARLAMTKASSPAVKAFATRMLTDHGKANDELAKLAKDQSITLPDTTAAVNRASAKLANVSGDEFDRAYMKMQLIGHQNSLTLFEHQSQHGTDATIKAWAQKMLPTLREHQKMADEAEDTLGSKGKS
jgi:putative membrane protein